MPDNFGSWWLTMPANYGHDKRETLTISTESWTMTWPWFGSTLTLRVKLCSSDDGEHSWIETASGVIFIVTREQCVSYLRVPIAGEARHVRF